MTAQRSKSRGGRGKRTSSALVEEMRARGCADAEIRHELLHVSRLSKSRASELLSAAWASDIAAGARAAQTTGKRGGRVKHASRAAWAASGARRATAGFDAGGSPIEAPDSDAGDSRIAALGRGMEQNGAAGGSGLMAHGAGRAHGCFRKLVRATGPIDLEAAGGQAPGEGPSDPEATGQMPADGHERQAKRSRVDADPPRAGAPVLSASSFPSGDVASLHDTLIGHARAIRPHLQEHEIVGDGNCLFRAAGFAAGLGEAVHSDLRGMAVAEVEARPEWLSLEDDEWATWMRQLGFYGDHLALAGVATAMRCPILVFRAALPDQAPACILPDECTAEEARMPLFVNIADGPEKRAANAEHSPPWRPPWVACHLSGGLAMLVLRLPPARTPGRATSRTWSD